MKSSQSLWPLVVLLSISIGLSLNCLLCKVKNSKYFNKSKTLLPSYYHSSSNYNDFLKEDMVKVSRFFNLERHKQKFGMIKVHEIVMGLERRKMRLFSKSFTNGYKRILPCSLTINIRSEWEFITEANIDQNRNCFAKIWANKDDKAITVYYLSVLGNCVTCAPIPTFSGQGRDH